MLPECTHDQHACVERFDYVQDSVSHIVVLLHAMWLRINSAVRKERSASCRQSVGNLAILIHRYHMNLSILGQAQQIDHMHCPAGRNRAVEADHQILAGGQVVGRNNDQWARMIFQQLLGRVAGPSP